MLPANQAVRIGMRAATRNPELAFGKALLDVAGSVLGLLPVLWSAVLLLAWFGDKEPLAALFAIVEGLRALQWPLAGAALCAALISWALSVLFWAGALPVLAADAELQARPPAGTFSALAVRGFSKLALASAVVSGISLLSGLAFSAGSLFLPLAFVARPSLWIAVVCAVAIAGSILVNLLLDLLGRLVLVRVAVLGDPVTVAFTNAASLLGARLGACLIVAASFFLLEVLCATAGGALAGFVSASADLDGGGLLLALAPRAALTVATGAIFAWLETARQGALAALAADAEGLITVPEEPEVVLPPPGAGRGPGRVPYRVPEPWELRPPKVAVQPPPRPGEQPRREPEPEAPRRSAEENVIEALPVPEEQERVIEALPVQEESVVEALPVEEERVVEAQPVEESKDASVATEPKPPPDGTAS
jgi:hypothetical protein